MNILDNMPKVIGGFMKRAGRKAFGTTNAKVIGHKLGDVTETSISFWVGIMIRPAGDTHDNLKEVKPEVNKIQIFENGVQVNEYNFNENPLVGGDQGFYKGWFAKCDNLTSSTKYTYKIRLSGGRLGKAYVAGGSFITAPSENSYANVKILVTSCMQAADKKRSYLKQQPAWAHINSQQSDISFSLFLGDTHYADSGWRGEKWHYESYQLKIQQYRKLMANSPAYAIYDDHDFLAGNEVGANGNAIPRNKGTSRRERVSEFFHDHWIIPGHNQTAEPNQTTDKIEHKKFLKGIRKGCYHKITYGMVDVYMLDTRYFREHKALEVSIKKKFDPNRELSLLGSENNVVEGHDLDKNGRAKRITNIPIGNSQWEWLQEKFNDYTLPEQNSRVKLLCFGSTYNKNSQIGESINHYPGEVIKLKELLKGHTNVHFLTGDVHYMRRNNINEFDTNPGVVEIISSGVGATKHAASQSGGYAILNVFPDGKKEISVEFYNSNPKRSLPENFVIPLKGI